MTETGHDDSFYNETDIIETTDEDGTVHVFEKIQELEVEGQEYALLIYKGNEYKPSEEPEEDEEVVVMRLSYEDGQEVFEAIEDEAEFERVVAYIETMEDDEESEVAIDIGDFLAQMGTEEKNAEKTGEKPEDKPESKN